MSPSNTKLSNTKQARAVPRSLPVGEWPEADRRAWEEACRPGVGLRRGGSASRFAQVSRDDFARRYGAFLGFLQRSGSLDLKTAAAAQVTLPFKSTKTKGLEERPVPEFLNHSIDLYLKQARTFLIGPRPKTNCLWISSRTGQRYTTKNLGTLISKITFLTVGVDVSPHLFRTAGATTAAMYGGDNPYLASAFLGHSDPRVAHEHYIRATTVNAAKEWGAIVRQYRTPS